MEPLNTLSIYSTLLIGTCSVVVLLIIYNLTRPVKKQKFLIKKPGVPDMPITYNVQDLKVPIGRVSGLGMVILKWLARTVLKNIMGEQSIRNSNLDLLRKLDISDCPTIIPLPLPSWKTPDIEDVPIDFNKYLKAERKQSRGQFKYNSITDLTRAYRSGETTPVKVAMKIIEFIKDSDQRSPQMRAFTQYEPYEIYKMAEDSAARYAKGKTLSFLDGVPVGVKEEFDVIPHYSYNGTTFFTNEQSREDASIVKKLRDGGAMIIGMTNMHEIGIGVTGNNANRLHGTPRNPYNVEHYTGGSSSGSAAAVASGLCIFALGTDGGGSIRMPAAACGVVGVKASFGRINTAGVVHTAHTVTHAGPICNNVTDAALVYGFIAGKDDQDMCSLSQPPVTLRGFEKTASLQDVKIGIDWSFFKHTDAHVFETCNQAVNFLKEMGCKVESLEIPELEETRVAHTVTILSEMGAGMSRWFDEFYAEMNADTALSLGLSRQLTAIDYFQAQKQRTRAMIFLEKIFDKVDCIITPALGTKVPVIRKDALQYGEADPSVMGRMMRFMSLGNLTGIPGIVLPVGYDDRGLPISLQVMSGWWREDLMLRVAKVCEGFTERIQPAVYYNILG